MRQITSLCKNNKLISEYALLSENALENKSENGKLSLDPQETRKESTSWLTLAMACQSSWFDENIMKIMAVCSLLCGYTEKWVNR